ncbi:MAG: mechanosensitive ion channel family protein [Deltaproteobacteria bacterium]|nr:mechanosensitive ion channel family protein [Deltaproteobacteria bacterium]
MWRELLIFASVFAASSAGLFIVRSVSFGLFERWTRKTGSTIDDILMLSVRRPSIFWAFAVAFYIALGVSNFHPRYVDYGQKALYAAIVLSVTIAAAGFVSMLVQRSMEASKVSVPATGLSKTIIRVLVFAVGFLVILHGLGISITPFLTALGVGGFAVALAIQDTLSNIFAGVYILVEKPFSVGDYIKLDAGEEGYVADIGWRTTRIRKLQNNFVIIPNNKLSQSIITNYNLPEMKMSLLIPVSVSYDSDPDEVERLLVEEAKKAIGDVPGLLPDQPFVRFIPGFGQSSLDFTLNCQVSEFVDQYLVQHELRKRILKRFRAGGIEMPFPVRTVYLKKE